MTTVQVDLGYRPRLWQGEVHRNIRQFTVLKCHRRSGKTVLAVMELIRGALASTGGDWRGAYIAPFYKQAKTVAWGYVKKFASQVPGAQIREAELTADFPNGSRISLFGADNPDALRGLYLDFAVMDEIAQMKPETWEEVVSVALMDRGGGALFIGTVKGYTLLSKLYNEALRDDSGLWWAANYTWRDTQVFSEAELGVQRRNMSEEQFRQEFENDDSVAGERQILSMELVQPAIGKDLIESRYDFAPKVLGVDVAYSAVGDRSVIFPRQGLAAFRPEVHRGLNNMGLADRVARFINEWEPDAVFVDSGRGEGVISRLTQLGHAVIPVVAGAAAFKPHYANKRVEMWDDGIKPWLIQGGALPPGIPGLLEDLIGPNFRPDSQTGKLAMETADQMKARGLPSPDLGMALAFTFASPVAPRPRAGDPFTERLQAGQGTASMAVMPKDPYDDIDK